MRTPMPNTAPLGDGAARTRSTYSVRTRKRRRLPRAAQCEDFREATMAADRRPWPMKWIILAMILFAVPYTYLTLHFRKPGPSYEPYKDAREKTLIARSGFRRVSLSAVQADSAREIGGAGPSALISASPGGLPGDLRAAVISPPFLPAAIGQVSAPASLDSERPYPIRFACMASSLQQALSGARLYIRGTDAYLLTDFVHLPAGLSSRTEGRTVAIDIPPGTFDPGKLRLTLVGQNGSRTWELQVR